MKNSEFVTEKMREFMQQGDMGAESFRELLAETSATRGISLSFSALNNCGNRKVVQTLLSVMRRQ
ncbi:hypothetical protein CWS02_10220 [Enterobacter sp. EA-1]|nr:hypothetical protein CWS02_10220 [Enterobacter sp. EA-1]